MIGEVQWNVKRAQKLHLDWRDPARATGCMDNEILDQVQERFAAIAMLIEDVSARLLATSGNVQEATDKMKLLRRTLIGIDEHARQIELCLAHLDRPQSIT
jgi:hypothetical protein